MANTTNSATSIPIAYNSTQPKWFTIPRVLLGLILIAKGFSFFKDSNKLTAMFELDLLNVFTNNIAFWSFFITYAHLLGGVFIAWGLFTRWVCILQIPILLGALVFIFQEGIITTPLEIALTVFTLILLLVFVAKGSGPISADAYFKNYTKAAIEPGHTKDFLQ